MNSEQIAFPTLAAEGIATGYFRTFDRGGLWRLIGPAASGCEFRGRWNDGVSRNDDYGMEKQ